MSKCLHIPLGEQYRKHVRVFYRWKKMMEGGKAKKNKSRKSSKTAACKSKITSVKNHNIYVKSSMTHSSHSAKCLTPAAVLIRCSACCCGVLLGLRLLGCAVKKKKEVLYRASSASNMLHSNITRIKSFFSKRHENKNWWRISHKFSYCCFFVCIFFFFVCIYLW